MIRLTNIRKSYGEKIVLDGVTLEAEKGKILCVLGESGGGKTTLLNILAGLTDCEGTIEGKSEAVSYIFQEPRLISHLTVRQNLRYVGGRDEMIDELLAAAELSAHADKRPFELSGGEKQRVAFVRAFLRDEENGLLLMDEPFSSLDTALKIRLAEVFARLWKRGKSRAAVFVTHDLEEALMLGDRVVVLKAGKIALDLPLEKTDFPAPYGAPRKEREILLKNLLK